MALGIALGIVFNNQKEWKNIIPLCISLLFYIVIIIYYHCKDFPNVTYPQKKCENAHHNCSNSENRLQWPYPIRWYIISFFLSLFLLGMYVNPTRSKIFLVLFFIMTFLIILWIDPKSIGSVWCFSSAILAPIVVCINYFLVNV